VLEEVGAGQLPQIEIFNKCDLVGESARVESDEVGQARRIWLSARTGEGTDLLISAMGKFLGPTIAQCRIRLKLGQGANLGRARARLYAVGAVKSESATEDGEIRLDVSMPALALEQLCRSEGISPAMLEFVE